MSVALISHSTLPAAERATLMGIGQAWAENLFLLYRDNPHDLRLYREALDLFLATHRLREYMRPGPRVAPTEAEWAAAEADLEALTERAKGRR